MKLGLQILSGSMGHPILNPLIWKMFNFEIRLQHRLLMINDPRRTDYVSIVRLYTIIEKAGFTV